MQRLSVPERPYADPWLLPLAERLQRLQAGARRVAYYYEAPNNSTFRYRAYNMAQVLNADPADGVSASWFHRSDLGALDAIVDGADLLVVCRSGYESALAHLIGRMRRRGRPVLFDVDDLVFDTAYTHLVIDTLALDKNDPRVWDDWFGMMARMGRTLCECDGAITTNDFLAERIRDLSGRPVAVVPNFMNAEQLAMSEAVWTARQAAGFAGDGAPTLGYFSGSPSHRYDFAIVEPALARLLDEQADLNLLVAGYIEPGPELARHAGRVRYQPFTDYVNLQRLVGTVEINLMPLQANSFTDCKSALKYFEAAAAGTLSVASPSANYAAVIRHGDNGWIARAHEWARMLGEVLQAVVRQPARYGDHAARARADALARFGWTTQRPAILRALGLARAAAPVAPAAD